MRILAQIAISIAILVGSAANLQAGQSNADPAPKAPEGICSIKGRVTIDNRGASDVVVVLQAATGSWPLPPPVARATTDKEGRFQMDNAPAGRYYLIPLAPAYFAPSEDRMIASGKPITLTKGENLDGVELALTPGGVITGRVTTAGGYPVIGKRVFPRLTDIRAQQQLPHTTDASSMPKTDDRGIYRIYGLPTGRYIVSVESQVGGQGPWTFHPGVAEESQAKAIEVTAGNVTENVDIKMPPIPHTYEVSGRVVDEATGHPIQKIRVDRKTFRGDGKTVSLVAGGAPTNENGEFNFTNLSPGRYCAYVAMNSGGEYYSDQAFFEVVDQDVTGVEIKARRAASLSGTIVIEGSRDPAILNDLSNLRVTIFPQAGGMAGVAQVMSNGRFRIPGLAPNKYRFSISSRIQQQNFSLLGVERDGVMQPAVIEVAAGEQVAGLRVVVSYGTGVILGQAQIVGGALPEGAGLSAHARRAGANGGPSSIQSSSVDARGRFVLGGLATGVYDIILDAYAPSQPGSAAPFRRLATAKQTVTMTSGTELQLTLVLDLSASTVREQEQ